MNNLYLQAKICFLTADPDEKIELTREATGAWQANRLSWMEGEAPQILNNPGRPEKPEIVQPRDLPKRNINSEKGRAALIHAMAHIELTAINLAWDSVYRYREMPKAYYDDWVQCANEEAGHFLMLRERLRELGHDYGSFPAHNGLWEMAVTTADDLMDRMGIIHRVFEARALDVVPNILRKFEQQNDRSMVKALTVICNDEVGHVSAGTRWFRYRCEQEGIDPDTTFFALLKKYMKNSPAGPFNYEVRMKCGFSEGEMGYLERNSP